MDKDLIIQEIFDLFSHYGDNDYIGESVTQELHMRQCAMLLKEITSDPELIVAGLLHDIGHLLQSTESMGNLGIMNHETLGKEYLLSRGFTKKVSELVGNHVNSKRYLVSKNKYYYYSLSSASQQTLEYQGGPMDIDEMNEFERSIYFNDSLTLRYCDDRAKDPHKISDNLIDYIPLIKQCII